MTLNPTNTNPTIAPTLSPDSDAASHDGRITVHRERDGLVTRIVIDRARKLNALTLELLDDLYRVLREVNDSDARVVLINTGGDTAFCVGADITRFAQFTPAQMWKRWIAEGHRVFDALARLRQPTIAIVDGVAVGGGLELALACDLRVATSTARLGLPETGLGTVPGWGGTGRLTAAVGAARAKELIFTRRQLDAATALNWGLLTAVAEPDQLTTRTDEIVEQILAGAPAAVQVCKQLVDAAAEGAPAAILEALASGFTAATDDFTVGVDAFRAKTTPTFTGR